MDLKGSKTEVNLMMAWLSEAQTRTKYDFYASQARKDGYVQIAKLFEETAGNEKEHAKIWFKLLHDGEIASTPDNLADSIVEERKEWTNTYLKFAKEAREEGFNDIADTFEKVANIEANHEKRYKKLLENIKEDSVFSKDVNVVWQCSNCGHTVVGKEAPKVCPVCDHEQGFFMLKAENY